MRATELFESLLTEHNVVNANEVKVFANRYVERTDSPAGKQWFSKKLPAFIMNSEGLLDPYYPQDGVQQPAFVQKAVAAGERLFQFAGANADLKTQLDHLVDWFNAMQQVVAGETETQVEIENKSLTEKELTKVLKYDLPRALVAAESWYQRLGKGTTVANSDFTIVKRLADGWFAKTFNNQQAMIATGNELQNCLRQAYYWEPVSQGTQQVYAICKPSGEAVVGIRVDIASKTVVEVKGKQNQPIMPELIPYTIEFLTALGYDCTNNGDLKNAGVFYKDGKFGTVEDLAEDIGNGVKVFNDKGDIKIFSKKVMVSVSRTYQARIEIKPSRTVPETYLATVLNYVNERQQLWKTQSSSAPDSMNIPEYLAIPPNQHLLFYKDEFTAPDKLPELPEADIAEIRAYYAERRGDIRTVPGIFISKALVLNTVAAGSMNDVNGIDARVMTPEVMAECIDRLKIISQHRSGSKSYHSNTARNLQVAGLAKIIQDYNLGKSTLVLNAFLKKIKGTSVWDESIKRSYMGVLNVFDKTVWDQDTVQMGMGSGLIEKNIEDIPQQAISKDVCLTILGNYGGEDQYPKLPAEYRKDEDFVLAALKASGNRIAQFVPKEQVTESFFYNWVQNAPQSLDHSTAFEHFAKAFPPAKWTKRIWLSVVGRADEALYKNVPKKFQDEDMLMAALGRNLTATLLGFSDPIDVLNRYKGKIDLDRDHLAALEAKNGIVSLKGEFASVSDLPKKTISAGDESGEVAVLRGPSNLKAYFFDKSGAYAGYLYTKNGKIYVPNRGLRKLETLVAHFANENLTTFEPHEITQIGIQKAKGRFTGENEAVLELQTTFDSNFDYARMTRKSKPYYEVLDKEGEKLFSVDSGSRVEYFVSALDLIPLNGSIQHFLHRFTSGGSNVFRVGIDHKSSGWSSEMFVFASKKIGTKGGFTVWRDAAGKYVALANKNGIIAYGIERADGRIDNIKYDWHNTLTTAQKEKIAAAFGLVEEKLADAAAKRKDDKAKKTSAVKREITRLGFNRSAYDLDEKELRKIVGQAIQKGTITPSYVNSAVRTNSDVAAVKAKWNDEFRALPDAEKAAKRNEFFSGMETEVREVTQRVRKDAIKAYLNHVPTWELKDNYATIRQRTIDALKREHGL